VFFQPCFEADSGFIWTDGDAALPMPLLARFSGSVEIVLMVGCTTQVPTAPLSRQVGSGTNRFEFVRQS
jgi:hypothetical protein